MWSCTVQAVQFVNVICCYTCRTALLTRAEGNHQEAFDKAQTLIQRFVAIHLDSFCDQKC